MKKLSDRLGRVIDNLTMGRLIGLLMLIMGVVLAERPSDGAAIMIRRLIVIGPQGYGLVLCFFGAALFVAQPNRRNAWLSFPLIVYLLAETWYAVSPGSVEPMINAVLFWGFYALMIRLWTMPPAAGRDIMTVKPSDIRGATAEKAAVNNATNDHA